MPDSSRHNRTLLRFVPLLGIALLAYLMSKLDVHALAVNAKAIAWGLLLVIALGGLSHVVKTCAWLLTMRGERTPCQLCPGVRIEAGFRGDRSVGIHRNGWRRNDASFLARVGSVSSRSYQFGNVGPRALHPYRCGRHPFAGIAGIGFAISLPHAIRLYAVALVIGLLCLLGAGAIAIQRKWPVLSASARAIAWIPGVRKWLASKQSTLIASEQRIVAFYHDAPGAFWLSVLLNLLCHFLAIVEVYICLRMLGAHATLARSAGDGIADETHQCRWICESRQCGHVRSRNHVDRQACPLDGNAGPVACAVPPGSGGLLGHHWRALPCMAVEKAQA